MCSSIVAPDAVERITGKVALTTNNYVTDFFLFEITVASAVDKVQQQEIIPFHV